MKKTIALFSLIILSLPVFAQTTSDALRYSQILFGGTARSQGLAGAMGAVGADFSVIATNPGGLGLYKSSEFSFTPSFWISNTKADYNGTTSTDNRVNFALGNIGFVLSLPTNKRQDASGLKNINFAMGINRQSNFNNRVVIMGQNDKNSMLTDWVNILNSQPGMNDNIINENYPFDIALARNTDLIFYDSASGMYGNDAYNGGVYQIKSIRTAGSMNEFDLAAGININDKWYIGATIGVPWIRYIETTDYSESKTNENIPYFRYMDYQTYLETHGTGINFKVGVVYRPANWVRIGAAIHTPTFFGNMRDYWYSNMYAEFDSTYGPNYKDSPEGSYEYLMTTPFRAIGSVAFIVGPYGLISAEYEYVNYDQARYHDRGTSATDSYSSLNSQIKDGFRSPVNFRVGTEWRLADYWRIRGGFGYIGSPYQDNLNTGERMLVSGGLGYRGKHVFADLSYVWSKLIEQYYLYDPALVNPSNDVVRTSSVVMTWGVRF